MLDVAPTELLLVAVVAVLVIGPKDLPRAMRAVGHWVGRARGVARQFRQGFDDMVREAEFKDMEKKWAEENARIMREFPSADTPALPAPAPATTEDAPVAMTVEPAFSDAEMPAPASAPEAAAPAKPAPRKRAPRKPAAASAEPAVTKPAPRKRKATPQP